MIEPYIYSFSVCNTIASCIYFRVMVLDHGQMKEYDAPSKLLQDSTSMFYSLAKDAGIV